MAVSSDMQAALYTLLLARHAGDTTSGGLNNSASSNAAYTKRFILEGDPNYDTDRLANARAQIVVSIAESDDPALGAADSATAANVTVRMLVLTKRDGNRTNQNAVNARVRERFDAHALGSSSPWAFSTLTRTGGRQLRATAKFQRYVHEFACLVVYAPPVEPGETLMTGGVIGRAVSLTFASNLGVTVLMRAVASALAVSSPTGRAVTRWSDVAQRLTRREQVVRMRASFHVHVGWPMLVPIAKRSAVVTANIGGTSYTLTNMLIEDVRIQAVTPRAVRVDLDLAGTAVGPEGALITL